MDISNKEIVLWATSNVAYNILTNDSSLKPSFLVDNSPMFYKKKFLGYPVYSPSVLKGRKGDIFVIVCAIGSKSQKSIYSGLFDMNFGLGTDFIDYSDLYVNKVKERLEEKAGFSCNINLFLKSRAMILASDIENQSTRIGAWVFLECLRKTKAVPGDIAEMGVYYGGTAWLGVIELLDTKSKKIFHLMDSFEGFASPSSTLDPNVPEHKMAIDSREFKEFSGFFSSFPNTRIHKGYFSNTLHDIKNDIFSLVHIDCDLYNPTKECLEFFWPRMSPKGLILVHDYVVPPWSYFGVKKAIDEFLSENSLMSAIELVEIPESTHALICKK